MAVRRATWLVVSCFGRTVSFAWRLVLTVDTKTL
jgi:hypothetical protein